MHWFLEVEGLAGLLLRTDTFEPLVIKWKCQVIWKVKRKYKLNLITFFDTHTERERTCWRFFVRIEFLLSGRANFGGWNSTCRFDSKVCFLGFPDVLGQALRFHLFFVLQTSSSSPFLLHVPDCQTHFLFVLFLIQREKAEWKIIKRETERENVSYDLPTGFIRSGSFLFRSFYLASFYFRQLFPLFSSFIFFFF